MIERYQDLVHSELTDHVKTHQNSTFKLVKICEYMIYICYFLFLNLYLVLVSDFMAELNDIYRQQNDLINNLVQVNV